jgi:hypothetical protein
VRTFAQEVKHVAGSNYFLFASVTGEKIPDDFKGGNGFAAIKTKAEILKFLKDSFAVGHRAAGNRRVFTSRRSRSRTRSTIAVR